ncbi:hypothetical protein IMZ48_18785 [Candidatus Bathyarchaeota archaeon]|nr:hypothetical protein [Candidatus Bathyarchaeota archaeon]
MSHSHFERVANLFRPSAESHTLSSAVKTSLFPHTHTHDLPPDYAHSTASSEHGDLEHHELDEDDAAAARTPARIRLADLAKMQHAPRRRNRHRPFSFAWHGKEAGKGRSGPAVLDCVIESPPVVFHGAPEDSTGALVSGQLVLEVLDERVEVDNLQASIVMRVVQKRPFHGHCGECGVREAELKQWGFLRNPVTLPRGMWFFLSKRVARIQSH